MFNPVFRKVMPDWWITHYSVPIDFFQYHQRVRSAAEGGAQAVPGEGADPAAQSARPLPLPRPARLLRRPVPRERSLTNRAGIFGLS